MTRIKNTSKEYWTLVRKLVACEKERDEERRARERAEYDVEYLAKELDEERRTREQEDPNEDTREVRRKVREMRRKVREMRRDVRKNA